MIRFKTQMRGYDKKEVEAYIHKTTEFSESKIRELENCIDRLKEENDYLYAKNSEYRRNEERVSAAIVKAMEVKRSIEDEYRAKVALEEDRLLTFKEKWIAYVQGIRCSNSDRVLENIEEYISAFRESFIIKVNRDLNIKPNGEELSPPEKSYFKEQQRILDATIKKKGKSSAITHSDGPETNVPDPSIIGTTE